jgi:hypothetical protein
MTNRQLALILIVLLSAFFLMGSIVTQRDVGNAVQVDGDYVAGTIDLAASSTQYTFPDPTGSYAYMFCARGNRAYLEFGTNPTVTTSAGGYTFSVPDGACMGPFVIKEAKMAHIAGSAVGQVEVIVFNASLQ